MSRATAFARRQLASAVATLSNALMGVGLLLFGMTHVGWLAERLQVDQRVASHFSLDSRLGLLVRWLGIILANARNVLSVAGYGSARRGIGIIVFVASAPLYLPAALAIGLGQATIRGVRKGARRVVRWPASQPAPPPDPTLRLPIEILARILELVGEEETMAERTRYLRLSKGLGGVGRRAFIGHDVQLRNITALGLCCIASRAHPGAYADLRRISVAPTLTPSERLSLRMASASPTVKALVTAFLIGYTQAGAESMAHLIFGLTSRTRPLDEFRLVASAQASPPLLQLFALTVIAGFVIREAAVGVVEVSVGPASPRIELVVRSRQGRMLRIRVPADMGAGMEHGVLTIGGRGALSRLDALVFYGDYTKRWTTASAAHVALEDVEMTRANLEGALLSTASLRIARVALRGTTWAKLIDDPSFAPSLREVSIARLDRCAALLRLG